MDAPVIEKLNLSELEAADYNPRGIDSASLQGLKESLANLNLLELPVVNVADGNRRLVSGHQRVRALIESGVTHADCILVEMDEVTEKLANLSMNNPAIRGEWDIKKAADTLQRIPVNIPEGSMRLPALHDQIRVAAARLTTVKPDEDAAPVEREVHSSEGVIYQLGEHRLLCGSSLDMALLKKLFGKKRAKVCITDPPYNVAYKGKTDTADYVNKSIKNDDMSDSDWAQFVDGVAKSILWATTGPCYVFMSTKELGSLEQAWQGNGGSIHRWMFWVKNSYAISFGDYHQQHECLLYGAREKAQLPLPKTPRTNVLLVSKPLKNHLHPTQKPLELIKMLVDDATDPGDLIVDLFGGSGTTLIVAEATGRVCYMSELDPLHADTIRKRWAEHAHGAGCDWVSLTPPVK